MTYDSFQVVGGAPGYDDGTFVTGAVGLTYLAKEEGVLAERYDVAPILGQDAMGRAEGLGFGTNLLRMDVTESGAGIEDLVATAPLANDKRGGFAWTRGGFSSTPTTTPEYFKWEYDPAEGHLGWPGDSMELLLVDLSAIDGVGLSLYSETNHVWTASGQGQCIETPVNLVNTTSEMLAYIPSGDGWGDYSAALYGCGGTAGNWTGHTYDDDLCEGQNPPYVDVGDPWPRQAYGHDPRDECGDPRERVMFPLVAIVDDGPPYLREADVTQILIDSTVVFTEETLDWAVAKYTLTPEGTPPSEFVMTFWLDVQSSLGTEFLVNNSDPDDLKWNFKATGDTWVCE